MTTLIKKQTESTDSEEYLRIVSHINTSFANLLRLLDNYAIKDSSRFLNISYDCFVEEIQKDLAPTIPPDING